MIMDEKIGLGKESRFEFKYVPTLTRTTRLGERRSARFERPGVETLAQLGLLAAFSRGGCFRLGFDICSKSATNESAIL
jgi:hypothetical protein